MGTTALRRSLGTAAGAALLLGAVACTTVQGSQGQQAKTTSTPSVTAAEPTSTAAVPVTAATSTSEDSAKNTTKTKNTTTTTTTATTTTKQSGGSGSGSAKVDSLTVVRKPSCPVVGTPDAPFSKPGVDVIIAWKVSGAPGAALAVDNPTTYGGYGSDYPATGQLELAFPCDGGTSGTTSHTYTVWPQGAKGVSRTITISAQNAP